MHSLLLPLKRKQKRLGTRAWDPHCAALTQEVMTAFGTAWSRFYETIFGRNKHVKPGTDVMIFKIFLPKILAKKLAFLTQNKAKF
jgi:hypothetical protein